MFSTVRNSVRKIASKISVSQQRPLSVKSLKEVLAAQIPGKQEALKKLKKEYGDKSLGEVTVDQCIGGGRDVKCMYYETSLLDAQEVLYHDAIIIILSCTCSILVPCPALFRVPNSLFHS